MRQTRSVESSRGGRKNAVRGARFVWAPVGVFAIRRAQLAAGSPIWSKPRMPPLGGVHESLATPAVKALLHGGPLDDSWWTIADDDDVSPPRVLVPQEGLGEGAEPLLLADFPVPVGGWRYELETRDDSRVVYVWARDERPQLEFVAVCQDGPAAGYRMDVLGLTEPWRYMRLVRRPPLGPLDGGHMEWMHIPWPDTPAWEDEVCYELTGTLIPPRGGIAEAFYRQRSDTPSPPTVIRDRQR